MTPDQYANWKDFALRMARHADHGEATDAQRAESAEVIDNYIGRYEHNFGKINDWDGNRSDVYPCDDVDRWLFDDGHAGETVHEREDGEEEYEETRTPVGDIVSCCIRSGFDVAVAPSAGVVGYSLDDIRSMYPEGIPDWVSAFLPEGHENEPGSAGLWL